MPPRAQGRGGARGGGRGGGRGGDWAAFADHVIFAPAAHITTVGVRRPGYGSTGRPITVNVNSFTAEIPDGSIYHYDVISADKALPSRMNLEIITALQDHVAPHIFADTRVVFDGRKNLYAPVELDLGGDSCEGHILQFDVNLPGASQASPPKVYKVRLTRVAKINTEVLHRFIEGKQSQDNAVSTALMALNVVIRMQPSMRFPTKGRSFFTLDNSRDIGGGLKLVRGYFQSIRPAIGRMLINIDISTGVVYQHGPLIQLCLAYLNERNPLVLSRQLDERRRVRLGRFITGIRVETRDASTNNTGATRARVVRRLHNEGANEVTFVMRGGRSMTVARYFQEATGRALQFPSLLCVEVGQGALIPLELCTVLPGQLVKKEIPDDKKADLVKFSTMAPKARLESIRKGLDVLAYGQSEYVRKFGLIVEPSLPATQARVLKAPTLRYGPGSRALRVEPRNGSWNMADKRFYNPATIANWVLIVFESRFSDNHVKDVIKNFVEGCRTTGMTVTDSNPIVRRTVANSNIPDTLQAAGAACYAEKKVPPALFVVILPEGANDTYTIVKHWGDITKGVPTQCMKSRNCTRATVQFWANVALKVNVKMGGINVITDPSQVPLLSDPHNPIVVLGADVMHPGAGTNGRPSYAAVVSSVDSNAAYYIATHRVQESRQELISDLQSMTKDLLTKYMAYRNKVEKVPVSSMAPKRLVFYRDGVSEGQFQQVLQYELPMIKAACQELKIDPRITLVIVGKRHHIRLFPRDEDADRSGNCPAGTVVDRDIGHPTEFDYYLQSHGGLLGTSRPGHYSVLYDDNNLTADTMQSLSFALCHVYAGSTRSVSIPAPVYYADKVCARAKIHFDPSKTDGTWSESGFTNATETLEATKRDFKPVNLAQAGRMYFS
ncbi:argonaute-like protein [Mycena pura]|uniref:Argonaute-like protein n=1 Tax=Mycena pura TaxID=153505 RepID=A0AAD6VL66_9AGAR|nr:argonaute-like protein [Mycena pura]